MRVIKSRGMRWAGYVAHLGERRSVYRVLVGGNLRERDHLGDPDVDGRIILRRIFKKRDVGGVDWIDVAQDGELVNAVMNIRFP